MKAFTTTLLACMLLLSCKKESTQSPAFANNWDEDIYTFSQTLQEGHANLFFKLSKLEFNNDINILRSQCDSIDEEQMSIGLLKILAKVGDSHTGISLNKFILLPFEVQWLSDGLYLSGIPSNDSAFLGTRITGIGGHNIENVVETFRTVIAHENEAVFKISFAYYLRIYELLIHFNLTGQSDEIILNLEGGNELSIPIASLDIARYNAAVTPLFLSQPNQYYWFEKLIDKNLLYIQYNSCRERSDLSFQTFTNQIVSSLNNNPGISKLVFDLRHNSGGNSSIAKPLIDTLEELVDAGRIERSSIYVIIGNRTFSSALLNALEIKSRISPVLIGEPTGGKPSHYGEVKDFRLPNSHLQVRYSTKYFDYYQNNDASLYPDVNIAYSSTHFLNGIDPVMEWIIAE